MSSSESVDLLVIEDITRQSASIVIGLEETVPLITIASVTDARGVHDFLLHRGEWAAGHGGGIPRLVLLDLGKYGETAFSVLGQIAFVDIQSGLGIEPLEVFGDAPDPDSVSHAYHCGVDGYTLYPFSYSNLVVVGEAVGGHLQRLNLATAP